MSDRDIQRKVGLFGKYLVSEGKDPVETGVEMAILAHHLERDKQRKQENSEKRTKNKRR